MRRFLNGVFVAVLGATLWAGAALAQRDREHEPGKFDFYVLALSWSPTYCERNADRAPQQCGARPFSFVVHGLWPQYEHGFPQSCVQPPPRLPREIMQSMLDLMPAPRLVFHEWDRHGVCSGLAARAYFDLVRKARESVKIPAEYTDVQRALSVTTDEVEDAFVKSNPGMTRAGIAVTCGGNRLGEVRVCMTRDLKFRDCPEIDRRACRREKLVMPPVRGG
jgi:ribonuclease T2